MENNNSYNSSNNNNGTNQDPIDLLSLHWKQKMKTATTGSSSSSSPSSATKEPKPSHLNTLNSSGLFQLVSTDKMSVQYVGGQHHGHDVGAAQADCPAPTRKTAYYFEMTVRNAGDKGQVSIGFTGKDFNIRRQPG